MECNDLYTSTELRLLSPYAFCHFLHPQAPWTPRQKRNVNYCLNILSPFPFFTSFLLSFVACSLVLQGGSVSCNRAIKNRSLSLFMCSFYVLLPCVLFFVPPHGKTMLNFLLISSLFTQSLWFNPPNGPTPRPSLSDFSFPSCLRLLPPLP